MSRRVHLRHVYGTLAPGSRLQPKPLALVIDGEPDIVELIEHALGGAGIDTTRAGDGRSALRLSASRTPSLVLTELNLPELSGLEVCAALKSDPATRGVPIMFVTSRTAEADRVRAFESGADDYLIKPFSIRELTLRCQALLRTAPPREPDRGAPAREPLRWGPIEVDADRQGCRVSGRPVRLTPLELKLLATLLRGGAVLSTHQQLLDVVWNLPGPVEGGRQRLMVSRLRKKLELLRSKLGPAGAYILTVRGYGYRLAQQDG